MTFNEIGSKSYDLLKETEKTSNYYLRNYIHHKFPNVPITRLVILGKITGVSITAGIALYKYYN
jgi:hypothetical protein